MSQVIYWVNNRTRTIKFIGSKPASSFRGRGDPDGLGDLPKATWLAGRGPVSEHRERAAVGCHLPEEGAAVRRAVDRLRASVPVPLCLGHLELLKSSGSA